MSLIPNVPPESFSLSAIIIGYLLIDDTTANEQNALGNWLMLVAQVLCTNAFFIEVMNERGGLTKFGKSSTFINGKSYNTDDTINMLYKMINALQIEVENLKNGK